jgi:glycosyltransferase involved in cell wall biosynthesis
MFNRSLVLSNKRPPLRNTLTSPNKPNTIGVYSPYEYSIGGGESYISAIMSFFIKNGASEVYFFNDTPNPMYSKTLEYYFTPQERRRIIKKTYDNLKEYKSAFACFIHMGNEKESTLNLRLGKKQIYHCQFPNDFKTGWNSNVSFQQNYDMVIVNSDYTYEHYIQCSKGHVNPNKVHILYPCCINNTSVNTSVNISVNKSGEKIIFVTIGRIFENEKNNNNKYHDIIIRIFNRIQQGYSNYELHIIGSVKSDKWLKYLNNIKNKNSNIFIHTNLQNNKKNSILEKANYIIHAAGIDTNENIFPSMFEHFGISIIEGLMYNCVPICTNGGFPKFYINDRENGYLFNTGNDLYNIISSILNKTTTLNVNKAIDINKKIAERFSYKNYCVKMNSILMSI